MNRLERLYAVAEAVRRQAPAPVTAAWLADRFGVSRRTIERDLAALRVAGLPLHAREGRDGGHTIAPVSGRAVLTLGAAEVTALLLALAVADGAPFNDDARAATDRLLDALPPATQVQVAELRGRIRVARDPVTSPRRTTRTLEEAVRRALVVRLDYTDRAGRRTSRDVDAVGFYGTPEGWAFVAWCHLRQAGRMFRLDRIRRATIISTPAQHRDVDDVMGWVPDPGRAP